MTRDQADALRKEMGLPWGKLPEGSIQENGMGDYSIDVTGIIKSPLFAVKAANEYPLLKQKEAMLDEVIAVLEHTVEMYGKEGGPWNVPCTKGSWITLARDVLQRAKQIGEHNDRG